MKAIEAKNIANTHECNQLDGILYRIKVASQQGYHSVSIANIKKWPILTTVKDKLISLGYDISETEYNFSIDWYNAKSEKPRGIEKGIQAGYNNYE